VSTMRPDILDSPRIMALLADRNDKNVSLSSRISAHRSRVFYAISIPEYIETWLRFPSEEGLHFIFTPVAQQAFRIELYRESAPIGSVYGQCDTMNDSQIRYTWKTRYAASITNTVVDMKLLSVSGGCTLALKHRGFRDRADIAWHFKLWQLSLESLSRLMEK
jgi:uncharacterized protein YndB with AHSA1/START domain